MNWESLTSSNQLEALMEKSKDQPVVLFKHSTRCSISSMALNRLERSWNEEEMKEVTPVYLDLIQYRDLSGAIAHQLGVEHQSPQIIVVHEGKAIYDTSHMGISYQELHKVVNNLTMA
ncbi:bacillithiol system redox-active protein YtxJ [Reichenbachiella ulvae]|uniref:Bacillithiol system redox-active protein YtxJ n=1 Tax=Reichenbachiella ulvae TaxID=2980104 RepID=A0ABT3CZ33_9BACT|nr:bacillithiol system redox-active protein YtxJ [Reichenbachiella ulvae]MCV9388844.1 bacillithiol system redox-active protein YtxJ [Reichenbachiella ulvae]